MTNSETLKCPCPKKRCKHHGDCVSCRNRHAAKKNPPYCERVHKEKS